MSVRVALVWLAGCVAWSQTFPVAGVVVEAGGNAPLKRMRVMLAPSDHRLQQSSVVTGEDGAFSFQAPKGKFVLTAERGGVRQPFGQSGPAIGFGSLIITGAEQDNSHLVFRWFPVAAISGRVMDDRGEPVEAALVQLIRASVVQGRRRLATLSWLYTNDLGEYRFGGLAGGQYYLAATGKPWYAQQNVAPAMATLPVAAYAASYYPNAGDLRQASPVVLKAGAEARADFSLTTITGVTVHVNFPTLAGHGSAVLSLMTEGTAGVQGFQYTQNVAGRVHLIPSVPAGRYIIRLAGTGESPFSVRKIIDVGGGDVTVDLVVQPPPSVTGKLVFKNPDAKPRGTLYMRLVNESGSGVAARAVEADGSFFFPNVAVAEFRPTIGGIDGFFISQMTAEGAELKNGVLDVVDGASIQLTVVASNETGHLHGYVMDGEKPLIGVMAVLAPVKESPDPGDYRGFQTDSDGSFDWVNVRAGDYVLFAVGPLDFAYAMQTEVRPYMNAGKRIHIEAQGNYEEKIGLTKSQ